MNASNRPFIFGVRITRQQISNVYSGCNTHVSTFLRNISMIEVFCRSKPTWQQCAAFFFEFLTFRSFRNPKIKIGIRGFLQIESGAATQNGH